MSADRDFSNSKRSVLKGLGASALLGAVATVFPRVGEAQPKLSKMTIFTGTTPQFANLYVAHERGFFEKEGLPVEVTMFSSGSVASEAFQAGRGNVIYCGDTPALRLWTRNAGIGLCTGASYGHYSIVVARKGINTPADMRGKKVGVLMGSTAEYFVKLYLASANVDPKEVELINLQGAEMVTGIVRKDIDAFVLWEPFGTRAMQASPDVQIVTTGEKYFLEWVLNSTTADYAKSNPNECMAYVRGLNAASKWCMQNRKETTQIVAKYLKLDPALVEPSERINWTVAYTPKFRADMERLSEFLKLKLDWSKNFDTELLKKVDPTLVA